MSQVENALFDPALHMPELCRWNVEHGLIPPTLRRLPKIGLVSPMETPCAAGFLMQTDCSEAWIVELVSDPSASEFTRGRALVSVVLGLLSIARGLGYDSLRITTHWRGVAALAKRMGGRINPNLVVIESTSWVTE